MLTNPNCWFSEPAGKLLNIYHQKALFPHLYMICRGTAALLKSLDHEKFDVTVVSPRNYFIFSPLLPSSTVGTVELRSLMEPIRNIFLRVGAPQTRFLEAECLNVDPIGKTIECASKTTASTEKFSLPYDVLVLAVGAQNNTFGVQDVEKYAHFLKEAPDSHCIRNEISKRFEMACLPNLSPERRKELLSFVVVGGGPTGVEFAAELSDYIATDLGRLYPESKGIPSVKLVHSRDKILNMLDKSLSTAAADSLKSNTVELIMDSRVLKIQSNALTLQDKNKVVSTLPFSLCVWSTGIGPIPLTTQLIQRVPVQAAAKATSLLTDGHLRLLGADGVFALGDCASISQKELLNDVGNLFDSYDADKSGDLDRSEVSSFVQTAAKKYPQLAFYDRESLIEKLLGGDVNNDGKLCRAEFSKTLRELSGQMSPLPATAQVATQQGHYLGALLSRPNGLGLGDPFVYHHKGSFVYAGNKSSVLLHRSNECCIDHNLPNCINQSIWKFVSVFE